MQSPPSFASAKAEFDARHQSSTHIDCIVTVGGKHRPPIAIRDASGARSEEFYKWQFLHALIHSGLYAKDYVGAEVSFPKGNASSKPI